MKLSVVATLYESAAHVAEFHQRVSAAARALAGEDYELVLVNDGSPDHSLELAVKIAEQDEHVVVVDLSRNFGHHRAMMTGLTHARGDRVFLIDSDLEEEPEVLDAFSRQMDQEGCDVVYGVQEARKGGWFERVSGHLFYRVARLVTGIPLTENLCTVRLMTRRYVDALVSHQEREVFLAGLLHITGFEQRPHVIVKHDLSDSTYTLRRKLALLVNTVTAFSNAPLRAIFYFGVVISGLAAVYVAYLVFFWALGDPASGWTSVMASVWLLGGMMISFMGVVGIYLSKVFSEVKQRPYAIVRHIYGRENSA
jgi:putative glycosyltransferase